MKKTHVLAGAAGVVSLAGAGLGQTDPLYINNGQQMYRVQGGSVTSTWGSQSTFPFVVRSSVEAAPIGGGTGTTFDPNNGNIQGNFSVAGNGGTFDAATDGKNIYITQNFCFNGQMWKLDSNWQNAQNIYNYNSNGCPIGVTYDTVNGALWTSTYNNGGTIEELDGAGNTVYQFGTGIGNPSGLAYEKSTDTLWLVNGGTDQILQYSKSGQLMNTINTGTNFGSSYSAEFGGGVPAPGAAGLLGLSGLVAARRRRA